MVETYRSNAYDEQHRNKYVYKENEKQYFQHNIHLSFAKVSFTLEDSCDENRVKKC